MKMMSLKNRRKRYASLTSLEQVRMEREKLGWYIDRTEEVLYEEYSEIKDMFSLDNLIGAISDKIDMVQGVFHNVINGFEYAVSLFRTFRAGRRSKGFLK